jgi:hypothetical protein
MLYHTWSYEEMKHQLEERRMAHEHERRCAILDRERQSWFRFVIEYVGSQMVRIGTWLENIGHAGALVSSASNTNR